ncbi:hypothetical protein PCK1_000249 [Pneumocystis canis]|nr:hypothetical protein PCK1_000249 [Pneumocystis canis]
MLSNTLKVHDNFLNFARATENIDELTKENLQTISKPSINKQFMDKDGSIIEIFGFYKEEKLVLQGFYEFKVIKGLISIMSSEFDSSNTLNWYRIFSPLTHSIPIIENYSNFPLLNIPESWASTINDIYLSSFGKETIRIVVCGQKSSGKSTFTKNLMNKFLTGRYNGNRIIKKIHYIETDLSQPEFSPYGIISSHSIEEPVINPSFTHCTLPSLLKAHFFGSTSPQDNPEHFLLCINDMIHNCRKNIPTIINTPGWTKGIGLELLNKIVNLSNCTHIIYIGSKANIEAFDIKLIFSPSIDFFILPSAREFLNTYGTLKINATDLRTLSIISYFHSINISENNYHIDWKFNPCLLNMKPWIVKYDGDSSGIDAISILNAIIDPDDFYYAINGTIMALVAIDTIEKNDKNTWEFYITKSKDFLPILNLEKNPINPKLSHCLGLCILRGISKKSKELQILTPINTSTLNNYLNSNKKLILIKGNLELPISLMLNYEKDNISQINWNKAPYLTMENEGLGSKTWHTRRNIERSTTHI